MKNALIIVDMQEDFYNKNGALSVPGATEMRFPYVTSLRAMERDFEVVYTFDWHPKNHISFASNHEGKIPFEVTTLPNGTEQVLWPDHCVQGSLGSRSCIPEIMPASSRVTYIYKGTDPNIDSYSAFYDNNREKSTGLTEILREKGVTDCWFCGLALDYCVAWSALDAVKDGFNAHVIIDATRAIAPNLNRTLTQLINAGVNIVYSSSRGWENE